MQAEPNTRGSPVGQLLERHSEKSGLNRAAVLPYSEQPALQCVYG